VVEFLEGVGEDGLGRLGEQGRLGRVQGKVGVCCHMR
jgi:hypothetical protein